ncbi:MAG: glutamine phosphoribosylpyrophosphate amidotransferase [Bacteroidetes bacterium]|nr:glutamine phosphoribosylpyrophosphate amidotransferase [Bacteroidota bacterium]
MEKQHNRGQDGAGVAVIKLDPVPGTHFIDRFRSTHQQSIVKIYDHIFSHFPKNRKPSDNYKAEAHWYKENVPFMGELLLGHLRYGTYGKNSDTNCHPFLRENNWMTRNLAVAGNFNMTNVDELFNNLIQLGQHPVERSDTITVMEKIGHFLDAEVQVIFDKYKDQGYGNKEITDFIIKEMSVRRILTRAAKNFDGGFTMAGMIGHGDAFVLRDPNGIRPAYYYQDDEIVVVASERPAIQTAFNANFDSIKEIKPGHALVIKKDGRVKEEQILEPRERKSCSFERIYFSRGTDKEIYAERKQLGKLLVPQIIQAVNGDVENAVFSFIPNTAEVAFYGLIKGVENHLTVEKVKAIQQNPTMNAEELEKLIRWKLRIEKTAVKDVKMRTFISDDSSRDEMVSHVYDVTYGSVRANEDTLVVIDDSIVRGTTLQKSILSILDRLSPKKIIIVSSAPQIRYPDCYGIDMSRMNDFIAFRALIALIKEQGKEQMLQDVYAKCKADENNLSEGVVNHVKELYNLYTDDEISAKISEIVRPKQIFADVQVIYQTVENLHIACPKNLGDWYFTGDYPTPGGTRVANKAFTNYMDGIEGRAY